MGRHRILRMWLSPDQMDSLLYWENPRDSGIACGSILVCLLAVRYISLISVIGNLSLALVETGREDMEEAQTATDVEVASVEVVDMVVEDMDVEVVVVVVMREDPSLPPSPPSSRCG